MKQSICLSFSTLNNEVEYEVVLTGLNLALMLVAIKLEIRSDSQLIFGHIQWEYEAKDKCMAHYLAMVEYRLKKLDEWVIRLVPQKENVKADALAEIATTLPIKEVVMLPVYLKTMLSITLKTSIQYQWSELRLDAWHHEIPQDGEITRKWKAST